MTIYLNGKKEELKEGATVADILEQRKIRPEVVTVELNDAIVEKSKYGDTVIHDKDRIEFVYYMGGGRYAV